MKKVKDMPDEQLEGMLNMMKGNKDLMKQMYKAQGMNMSDEQLEAMTSMMNP